MKIPAIEAGSISLERRASLRRFVLTPASIRMPVLAEPMKVQLPEEDEKREQNLAISYVLSLKKTVAFRIAATVFDIYGFQPALTAFLSLNKK